MNPRPDRYIMAPNYNLVNSQSVQQNYNTVNNYNTYKYNNNSINNGNFFNQYQKYNPLIATHSDNKSIYIEPNIQNINNLNYVQFPVYQYQKVFDIQPQSLFSIQNQPIYVNKQNIFSTIQQPQSLNLQKQPIYEQQRSNIKVIKLPVNSIKNNNINQIQYKNYIPQNNINYSVTNSRNNNLYSNTIQLQPQIIKNVPYEHYPITRGPNISIINSQVINPVISYNQNINKTPTKIQQYDLLKQNKNIYSNILYKKNINNYINNNNYNKVENLNQVNPNLYIKKKIRYNTASYEPLDNGINETSDNLEENLKNLRNYFNSPIADNIPGTSISRAYSLPTRDSIMQKKQIIVPTKKAIISPARKINVIPNTIISTNEFAIPQKTPIIQSHANISSNVLALSQKTPVIQSYYSQPYSSFKTSNNIRRNNLLISSKTINNYNYSIPSSPALYGAISQTPYNSKSLNNLNLRSLVSPRKPNFIIRSNRPLDISNNSAKIYNEISYIPNRNILRKIYLPINLH